MGKGMMRSKALGVVAKLLAHTLDRFPLLDRAVAAAMREIERERACTVDLTLQRADMEQRLCCTSRSASVQAQGEAAKVDGREVN